MRSTHLLLKSTLFFCIISLGFSSCAAKKQAVDQTAKTVEQTTQTVEKPTPVNTPDAVPEPVVEMSVVPERLPVPPPPPPPPPPSKSYDVFRVVEQMPRFPGCENIDGDDSEKKACAQVKLLDYVYSQLKYPAIALENGIEGTCVVSFVVEKNGRLKDIRLIRDLGASCGAEAVRIVASMNDLDTPWIAGKQRGRPVNVQFTLPVKFALPMEDMD